MIISSRIHCAIFQGRQLSALALGSTTLCNLIFQRDKSAMDTESAMLAAGIAAFSLYVYNAKFWLGKDLRQIHSEGSHCHMKCCAPPRKVA